MAAILIDYENVSASAGMKGVEYLTEKDTLHIFFSQSCSKIRSEYMQEIVKTKCTLNVTKLLNVGKNYLDFYIAAEAGAIANGGESQIVIVSNDKGFKAVVDYFKIKENGVTVALASNIENGIIALDAPEDIVRRNGLKEKAELLDIASEYARIQELNVIKKKIESAFIGTKYEDVASDIVRYVEEESENWNSLRKMYTSSLRGFGKIDGTEIYHVLKRVV